MYISQLIAADAVHQVFAGRNLTLSLPAALSLFPSATPQQKGAAADLSYGTLRFYGQIDAYLTQLLEKPLTDERIHALLLVAIYQLLHDKAEAFTVVNQAVHAVSQLKRPAPKAWAKGLVNAILRNFLRQKDALAAKPSSNEVAQFSYPQWWIDKLKVQYPAHWQAILLTGNAHPPMTLRVNLNKTSIEEYLQILACQDIEANYLGAEALILHKPVPVERIPGFLEGVVSVQDYGAQLAAHLLEAQTGDRVLDACCAPGGKTGHILERNNVQMTALDNDELRLQRVQSNLDRLQLTAHLLQGDAATHDWYDQQPFDKILADVPCTASGIVRRHVDIKWLRRETDIQSFTSQQAKILASLWQMLAKGGKLLYVTCSVFYEENQGQVDKFLLNNDDASQLPLQLPAGFQTAAYAAEGDAKSAQLLPSVTHDGFFYALLQKH